MPCSCRSCFRGNDVENVTSSIRLWVLSCGWSGEAIDLLEKKLRDRGFPRPTQSASVARLLEAFGAVRPQIPSPQQRSYRLQPLASIRQSALALFRPRVAALTLSSLRHPQACRTGSEPAPQTGYSRLALA